MACNKKTRIPDKDFKSHEVLNQIPCVGSDRFLQKVTELVEVINICQDEANTSIVYMDFRLNGVFDYTPRITKQGTIGCIILRVDDDISFEKNRIVAPLMIDYHRSNPKKLPLNTECKTKVFTLAFDFGRVIPNFLAAKTIKFRLRMEGILPSRLNFQKFLKLEKSVHSDQNWSKGPTPNPYRLVYEDNLKKLLIYFQFERGIPCNCNILCKSISGSFGIKQLCEDKTSRVIIDYVAGNDPGELLIKFADGFGNTSSLNVRPLVKVLPAAPTVINAEKPKRVEIGISRMSIGGTKLDEGVAYQIWKYDESLSNSHIWRDWSYRSNSTFSDMDVVPGRLYGYAVRYRGTFGEESLLSGWVTVTV